jgi:putative ABC transport system permease protein
MIKFIFKSVLRDFSQYILAIIGLTIGITSLISMGYLGIIGEIKLFKEIEKQGINVIYISPDYAKSSPIRKNFFGQYPSIKDKEVEVISNIPFGIMDSIAVKYFSGNVKYGSSIINNVEIVGTNGNYLNFFNYSILSDSKRINGCYIGYRIFKEIFNKNRNIMGKSINISGKFIKIKGILKEKGASSSGRDQDNIIVMPMDIFKSKFKNNDFYDNMYVKPAKINLLKNLKKEIIFLLKTLHNNFIFPLKEVDFTVQSMDYYIQKQQRVGKIMVISTFIVSSITLLVGGIGVMAVMIILSIKEAMDIGIKRALGATKFLIFLEYLIKSMSIALISSIFGLCLGILSYFLINYLYGMSSYFPVVYAFEGIISSFVITLIFGTYPAYKASKIEPSTALHFQ